jgi:hypothetical protein
MQSRGPLETAALLFGTKPLFLEETSGFFSFTIKILFVE